MNGAKNDLHMMALFEEAVCRNAPTSSMRGLSRNHQDNISEEDLRGLSYNILPEEMEDR